MKRKVTAIVPKTARNGSTYYLFICRATNACIAVNVFPEIPVIGAESVEELVQFVESFDGSKGECLEVEFALDFNNNVQAIVVC